MDEPEIATHELPVWRDRADYLLQADLAPPRHGGTVRTAVDRDLRDGRFELCCLPFFTCGYALGDVTVLQPGRGRFATVLGPVATRSGRDVLRIALTGGTERPEDLHAALADSGRPHEWRGGGLVAIDIEGDVPDVIERTIDRLTGTGVIEWEWGNVRSAGEIRRYG